MNWFQKIAIQQMITPIEQSLNQNVYIDSGVKEYIVCEIKSTIQHEGGHRKGEAAFNEQMATGRTTQTFEQHYNNPWVEQEGIKEELNCPQPVEDDMTGEVISVNLHHLFSEAQSGANIPSDFNRDVKAGTLDPSAQGMYKAQSMPIPQGVPIQTTGNPNLYRGFDGTLWVDVIKIVQPWVIDTPQNKTQNPTVQTDGVYPDPQFQSTAQPAPATDAAPAVGGWHGRQAR